MNVSDLITLSDEAFLKELLKDGEQVKTSEKDLKKLYIRLYEVYKNRPSYRITYPVFDILFAARYRYEGESVTGGIYFKQASMMLSILFNQNWSQGTFMNHAEFIQKAHNVDVLFPDFLSHLEPLGHQLIQRLADSSCSEQMYWQLSTTVLLSLFNQKIAEVFCRNGELLPAHLKLEPLLSLDKSDAVYQKIQRLGTKIQIPSNKEEENILYIIHNMGIIPSLYEQEVPVYTESNLWM